MWVKQVFLSEWWDIQGMHVPIWQRTLYRLKAAICLLFKLDTGGYFYDDYVYITFIRASPVDPDAIERQKQWGYSGSDIYTHYFECIVVGRGLRNWFAFYTYENV